MNYDYLIYLLSIYIILFKTQQFLIKIFLCLHRILYSLILCKTVQFDSNEINVIQTRDFIKYIFWFEMYVFDLGQIEQFYVMLASMNI